jgi:hypothetical protein
MYILSDNGGRYLWYAPGQRKLSATTTLTKAARFPSPEKARRVRANELPKATRKLWYVMADPLHKVGVSELTPQGVINWSETAATLTDIYKALVTYRADLQKQHAAISDELEDLLHACEFCEYSQEGEQQVYAMMRERRRQRRVIKYELARINAVVTTPVEAIATGVLVQTIEKIARQSYRPRVLGELFIQGPGKR